MHWLVSAVAVVACCILSASSVCCMFPLFFTSFLAWHVFLPPQRPSFTWTAPLLTFRAAESTLPSIRDAHGVVLPSALIDISRGGAGTEDGEGGGAAHFQLGADLCAGDNGGHLSGERKNNAINLPSGPLSLTVTLELSTPPPLGAIAHIEIIARQSLVEQYAASDGASMPWQQVTQCLDTPFAQLAVIARETRTLSGGASFDAFSDSLVARDDHGRVPTAIRITLDTTRNNGRHENSGTVMAGFARVTLSPSATGAEGRRPRSTASATLASLVRLSVKTAAAAALAAALSGVAAGVGTLWVFSLFAAKEEPAAGLRARGR
jgi:hypothetical protein